MLSKKDKREFIKDGHSLSRKKEFAITKDYVHKAAGSLDEYIRFLTDIQKIFSPFPIPKRRTIALFNKL